jgi:membrane protease YdiL (CAAX protease family)
MNTLITELISSLLQVLVFTLIPFIFFLFRKDKTVTFMQYIGLYKAPAKGIMMGIAVSILFLLAGLLMVFTDDGFKEVVLSKGSVTGKIRAMGLSVYSVLTLLLMAWVKTSLSEEILFRGFIGKQLIRMMGFWLGNILQAMFFGFIHLLLMWRLLGTGFTTLMLVFFFSSFAGWAIGYVKVKRANGSIVPGWIAHGLGNTISYFIIAFCI